MTGQRVITIIGGGASGTLLAVNLLQQCRRPLRLNLVEKRDLVGRGVAYSTRDECHLLNVPAGKMGAFPADVEHFHRWLACKGYDYSPSAFVPRKLFGQYLADLLNEAHRSASSEIDFRIFDDEAVGVDNNANAVQVVLTSGERLPTDKIVLAFGNFLPPHPSVADQKFVVSPQYFRDPWSPCLTDKIQPKDSVMIIGTGLSMVDFAMRFSESGHTGKICAISTRGLLPTVHKSGFTYRSFYDELRSKTRITEILKIVRKHIDVATADGSDWRAVIDSLRPHTQQIWLSLPLAEKKYFMQHLSRYWNVARHRMPPEAALVIEQMISKGQLSILRGRLTSIEFANDSFCVKYVTSGSENSVSANVLINCIGSESNFERIDSRLVRDLLEKRLIRKDLLSYGLDATPDGTILTGDSSKSIILSTLGTSLKGVLWESTAIPEIRVQAEKLASRLLHEVGS